jgi:SAM-dependent methyltransferase
VRGARRAFVDASARVRAKLRMPRVITLVAAQDDMLTGEDLHGYFAVGESALESIRAGLGAAGAPGPTRILDAPSGYGRVLRYLKAAWPRATLTALDLVPDAARFCAETFGARAVVSRRPIWLVSDAGEEFDLAWYGSFLTHLDATDWVPTLRWYRDRLRPGGVLVFTTHGDLSISLLQGDPAAEAAISWLVGDYGMGSRARDLARDASSTGFAFRHYGDDRSPYGLSVSSPKWVRETATAVDGLRFVRHEPAGWFDHQDVWTYVRSPS